MDSSIELVLDAILAGNLKKGHRDSIDNFKSKIMVRLQATGGIVPFNEIRNFSSVLREELLAFDAKKKKEQKKKIRHTDTVGFSN